MTKQGSSLYTLPSSGSLGVSTPYLATLSVPAKLFVWLKGRLIPEMWDMVRPTRVVLLLLLDEELIVPDDTATTAVDDPPETFLLAEEEEVGGASLIDGPVLFLEAAEARAASESSTRSEGRSSSCCLSFIIKKIQRNPKMSISEIHNITLMDWWSEWP